ncbi:MAG: protein phosphatase 2C domain-containing protein [Kofleriaceae bacterium]|nr:protein phosphatase 2C domain-containing protein [Kofleriaceae bacterium]MCB9571192.1 protein phosphatase 2C domain-containing protein [Kofleriaceae bacterium]
MYTNESDAAAAPGIDLATVEVATGCVLGRDHRRTDRPCQDAVAVARADGAAVVAVADGCGSGRHSEVGARIGARVLATAAAARLTAGAAIEDPATWLAAADDVLVQLTCLIDAFGGSVRDVVHDHFLFTLVAAAVTPRGAAAFAIGDGVIVLGDDLHVLDAGPDNAPPYLAYRLLGAPAPHRLVVAPPATRAALVATDGATALLAHAGAPLPAGRGAVLDPRAVATDDRLWRNPDALRRRLAVASADHVEVDAATARLTRTGGVLADDTAIAALRWGPRC